MTDIIFLLLIFFMVTSTVVMPNAIPVKLPQASKQTPTKPGMRVTIDKNLRYYVGAGRERDRQVLFRQIVPQLRALAEKDEEMYVALYAEEEISYSEVIKLLSILQENKIKVALATQPIK
jgi:biopolymer transport protein ExbD